ncbi:MAG: hypothetical protein M4579_006535 [Chaenotheca gracillima]|nr:MAG: hypothetical protein M4579_006535 [Chaenotheca gracillima]
MTRLHNLHHALHRGPRVRLSGADAPSIKVADDVHPLHDRDVSDIFERTPPPSGSGGGDDGGSTGSSGSDDSDSSDSGEYPDDSSTSTDSSDASATTTSSSTCGPDDTTPRCQRAVGDSTNTLPIVLAVVIPVVLALVLFVFLHRRHLKKLRSEDANDKHKSLDFGLDPNAPATPAKKGWRRTKRGPEMMANPDGMPPLRPGRTRGMSMDMDLGSPYLLPPGLQSSHESLHSMSRTAHSADDRYRTGTGFVPNDGTSLRSYPSNSRPGKENSSIYTGSSRDRYESMNSGLIRNAQRMSRSMPPNANAEGVVPIPTIQMPEPSHPITRKELPPAPASGGLAPPSAGEVRPDSYVDDNADAMRRSNNYLGAMINLRASSLDADKSETESELFVTPATSPTPSQPLLQVTPARKQPPPAINTLQDETLPEKRQSFEAPIIQLPDGNNYLDDGSDYGDYSLHPSRRSSMPLQEAGQAEPYETALDAVLEDPQSLGAPGMGYDIRRLSMGVRPLPPEDPSDDPEARANRIRSFYKEYFDDSKPGPVASVDDYYEDYSQEYLGDAAFFDPDSGNFIMAGAPAAEPVTRRAMTPPPRAPPRFRGGPGGPRHQFSSSGVLMPHGPRAFSSASGRMGPNGPGRRAKPLPPPSPLRVLPTPHMLKEDSFALPIDFAPPSTYKDRQAGRPESPRGGLRPYSPMLPAHMPLASSFDDLAAMPSPHALRKSGTFTALDFAPPPRFKNETGGSDAGSIRSNRSNMSQQQLYNIRAGTYRLSRVPKETVGTKNELAESLRPSWDLRAK